ncbi:SHOCT domain-containing protein [Halorussus ruber]|uniref:SHOCT domain-containing protein n=1 Tax=Halorussus ruber TaxID=1126238 RepID=UPI0010931760|nr:SHOCT domain-containing protein [Halorussus ruber]
MRNPDDYVRRLASMFASRAGHESVTTARLAGRADAVADLESSVVTHLASGEHPKFCFECHEAGVGIGDPEDTVEPDRGGIYCFTDRRIFVQLGVGDRDESLSVPYSDVSGVRHREGRRRHRIDIAVSDAAYYLWIPASVDAAAVVRAAEYVKNQHTAESTDASHDTAEPTDTSHDTAESADASDEWPSGDPETLRERLERLGDAKSRGLIDEEEFQHRKERLLDE